jgi:tRNA 2-selenouridine synthase
MPGLAQPTQKRFDTLIWERLRSFDPALPVFVESESKKVGNLSVSTALIEAMRGSPCLNLQLPDAERVALLLEDYDYLTRDVAYFCNRLSALVEIRSRAVVEHWQAQARAGQFAEVVLELLQQHYDPAYLQSMLRNFVQFGQAENLNPADRSAAAMTQLARQLLTSELKLIEPNAAELSP